MPIEYWLGWNDEKKKKKVFGQKKLFQYRRKTINYDKYFSSE